MHSGLSFLNRSITIYSIGIYSSDISLATEKKALRYIIMPLISPTCAVCYVWHNVHVLDQDNLPEHRGLKGPSSPPGYTWVVPRCFLGPTIWTATWLLRPCIHHSRHHRGFPALLIDHIRYWNWMCVPSISCLIVSQQSFFFFSLTAGPWPFICTSNRILVSCVCLPIVSYYAKFATPATYVKSIFEAK